MRILYRFLLLMALVTYHSASFAQPVSCVGSDLAKAQTAQADSKGTLDSVIHFIESHDANTITLVSRWFGRNDQPTIDKVRTVLATTDAWVGSVALYCVYSNDGSLVDQVQAADGSIILQDVSGNVYAYVDPADTSKINLGLKFFQAPASGMNSDLGTIIHEVTHFFITGNTQDVRYGKVSNSPPMIQIRPSKMPTALNTLWRNGLAPRVNLRREPFRKPTATDRMRADVSHSAGYPCADSLFRGSIGPSARPPLRQRDYLC